MWNRIVLWVIFLICLIHILSWPYMKDVLGRQRYGTGTNTPEISAMIHQWETWDVIRLNFSWVCGTLAVIGLGVLRPKQS